MGNATEKMISEAEGPLEEKASDDREKMETLLMPKYFEKHEHHIKANFLEQLRKSGIDIRITPTWEEIRKITEKLFEEMCKKGCILPKRAVDIKVASLKRRRESQEATKKKMATLLGFSSYEAMMKCIELGKNLEEGQI